MHEQIPKDTGLFIVYRNRTSKPRWFRSPVELSSVTKLNPNGDRTLSKLSSLRSLFKVETGEVFATTRGAKLRAAQLG